MRIIFSSVFSILLALSATASHAVTLTYTGATYDQTRYSISSDTDDGRYNYFRGSYNDNMNVTLSFELSQALRPNTKYYFDYWYADNPGYFGDERLKSYQNTDPSNLLLRNVEISDGIHPTAGWDYFEGGGWLTTGSNREVSSWSYDYSRGATDYIIAQSNNQTGDTATYEYEFGYINDEGFWQYDGVEFAFASASATGTWSGTALIAPVPLPASIVFLLVGLGGLAMPRVARRRAS